VDVHPDPLFRFDRFGGVLPQPGAGRKRISRKMQESRKKALIVITAGKAVITKVGIAGSS
jgi:hypothetical protein